MNRRVAKVEHAATKLIRPPFSSEVTIIATGIHFSEREDLLEKTRQLVHTGLACPDVNVVRATRTQWRNNKPGLVKFELESVDAKIKLLRKKKSLMEVVEYKKVYLPGCKSHEERLIELNIREVMSMLPEAADYRFTESGRLIRKEAAGNPRREGGSNRDINEGGSAADRSTVGAGRGRGTGIQQQGSNSTPGGANAIDDRH